MSTIPTTKLTKEDFDRHIAYIDMTPAEFCQKVGVHLSTLYRWQRTEDFPLWVPLLLLTMRHNKYLRTKGEHRPPTQIDRLHDALA